VNVYVESNFVLELALLQEQQASCEEILRLSEAGNIYLVIPAYSIAEPYETLVRRHRQRKRMKAELDVELRQLARTTTYAQQLSGFQNLTALLIDSADEEAKRLEEIRERLLKTGEIIPLEVLTLTDATQYQRMHGLSPQDAIVYAAVPSHLKQ
jgi:predicted nucleic acid-binding protein